MPVYIVYYLPCTVSLLWTLMFLLKNRDGRQTMFLAALAMTSFYMASIATMLSPHGNYTLVARMTVIDIPVCLSLFATVFIYISLLVSDSRPRKSYWLLYLPALGTEAVVAFLYSKIGFDQAALVFKTADGFGLSALTGFSGFHRQLYRISTEVVSLLAVAFAAIISTRSIWVMKNCGYRFGDIFRFFFRGAVGRRPVIESVLFISCVVFLLPFTMTGPAFMREHTSLTVCCALCMALSIHFLGYIEYFSRSVSLRFRDLSRLKLPAAEDNPESGKEEAIQETDIQNIEALLLHKRFRSLMEDDKAFLDDSITTEMIAGKLDVSRSTLSNMINSIYGLPFRTVLAQYRIDFAKEYMIGNPKAKQEEIAMASGFKDAPSFNRKFKEVTGISPQIWLLTRDKKN